MKVISMTQNGVLSGMVFLRGRIIQSGHTIPAPSIFTSHFAQAPIPAVDNGVATK